MDKEINRQIQQIVNLSNDREEIIRRLQKFIDDLLKIRTKAIKEQAEVNSAHERKLIINIEKDTVLFDNLNDFTPLEFIGILHNAISTADVLYKTKVMQMLEKASKSD